MKKLSIYLHIPYCVQKCIYCNFISFPIGESKGYSPEKYFKALNNEIKSVSGKYKEYIVKTIYIGGGTPTCVNERYITEIINTCREYFKVSKNCEITIECNPNTLTAEKVRQYISIGVNRFSIGMQSGNDIELKLLNRPHNITDFLKAIEILKEFKQENYNIDMLIGLPGQTFENIKKTLNTVLECSPASVSAYGLIIEENTPLKKMTDSGELTPQDDETMVKYYDYVCSELRKNGYYRYEVSNFSKKGKESKHNMVYWQNGDYIGMGLSAHSKIGDVRFSNTENIGEYIRDNIEYGEHNYADMYTLSKEDKFLERIMLTLRTQKGLKISALNSEFDIDFLKMKSAEISMLIKSHFIYIKGDYIKVTQKGYKVLNGIIDRLT